MSDSMETFDRVARHADKGPAKIDMEKLRFLLSSEEFKVVMNILQERFPEMLKNGESPLQMEGIARSLHLGENLYKQLPERCVLLVMDSGMDRAEFTRRLVTESMLLCEKAGRGVRSADGIGGIPEVLADDTETQARLLQEHQARRTTKQGEKRIDILELQDVDLSKLMEYSAAGSWTPYKKMIERGELSASEANIKWIYDMNRADAPAEDREQAINGAERYRQLIRLVHEQVTEGKANGQDVPIVLFAVGHNESLAQLMFEQNDGEITADQLAEYCEQYLFDKTGKLVGTKKVDLEIS